MAADQMLMDWDDRLTWKRTAGSITASEILRGSEETSLTVVLAAAPGRPGRTDMRSLMRERAAGGVAPIIVAVSYPAPDRRAFSVLGLDENAVQVDDLEPLLAEQLIHDALRATSPSGLHAEVQRRLKSLGGAGASGVRNEGLFASRALDHKATEPGWDDSCARSRPLLGMRGAILLNGLGYALEAVPEGTVLREAEGGHRRAAAVLLADGESFENPLMRLQNANAVTHGLSLARKENLDWLVVLGGPVARLYSASPDIGVGRKGQTQTYVELDLSLLPADNAGYLSLIFAPQALAAGGTVARLLDDSAKYAAGLSERLRDRIYIDVVPSLAVAVANARQIVALPGPEQKVALDEAYHQTMIILFRLLFVAYGEDRGLLPYGTNDTYTRNSLKRLALDLAAHPDQGFSSTATSLWDELTQVWKVIDTGDIEGWGVPAYNGGLFTRDPVKNSSGAETYGLNLTNDQIGPVLRGLLIDTTPEGPGPVDFRSLSVREFGTIYEGLLESGLGVADTDLTINKDDTYVVSRPGDEVKVPRGEAYFHSRSGSRKVTGSYFTKPFAVKHLLNTALEPALDRHLAEVSAIIKGGGTARAAKAIFDFRVADLSMGSAHFLVAAVDRIEARLSAFLVDNPLPEVAAELHDLRATASRQLKVEPAASGIDDGALLRRLIARRCLYGSDINEIAVELARLGMWIHTFVPGLPLSFLNHGLAYGNSLTGVGTLREITEAIAGAEFRELKKVNEAQTSGLEGALEAFMDRARDSLRELAALSDASIGDVARAGNLQTALQADLAPLEALCDLITAERATRHLGTMTIEKSVFDRTGAQRIEKLVVPHPQRIVLSDSRAIFTATDARSLEDAMLSHPRLEDARRIAASIAALHFPVAFPEVFRRDRPGFDCILGNPPWEKLQIEEHSFYAMSAPGLRGLRQQDAETALAELRASRPDLAAEYQTATVAHQRMVESLSNGPFPGLTAGRPDLYKAFAWRFRHLTRTEGFAGVVLPRKAIEASGMKVWRVDCMQNATFVDVCVLANDKHWVFDGIDTRTTVVLLTLCSSATAGEAVPLRGPYRSSVEFQHGLQQPAVLLPVSGLQEWTDSVAFPLLPDPSESLVYLKIRRAGTLTASLPGNPVRGLREFNATDDRHRFNFEPVSGNWPVYTGGSFDLWNPDTGYYYASIDPEAGMQALLDRASNMRRTSRSAFFGQDKAIGLDPAHHPASRARVAWRDSTNRTNQRTLITALIPPEVVLVHQAYYLFPFTPTPVGEAYLLGVLSSIPFDWFARRSVETHATVDFINSAPIPGFQDTEAHHRVVELAGLLAATDARFTTWAAAAGVPVASVDLDHEACLAELDALVSLLYGLSGEDVSLIFATFHRGWDGKDRRDRVLGYMSRWSEAVT